MQNTEIEHLIMQKRTAKQQQKTKTQKGIQQKHNRQ